MRRGGLIGSSVPGFLGGGPEISLSVLSSQAEILSLEAEWRALLEDSGQNQIFLTWEWVSSWLGSFGPDHALRFFIARSASDSRLLGVAPLAIYPDRSNPLMEFRALAFIGQELAPDHLDLLIRNGHRERAAAALLDLMLDARGEWDCLLLDGIDSASPLLQLIEQRAELAWHHAHVSPCPYISLPDTFAEWLSGLSKKRRYKIGSGQRRLEEAYPGRVRISRVRTGEELVPALAALVRLHRSVRNSRHTGNAFRSEQWISFHKHLCELLLERDWLRLYLLSLGERDIAALYCFRYGGTVSFYSTGYDIEFSDYSPGMLLLVHAIKESVEEGAEIFDFLRGDETYKRFYTRSCRSDLHLRVPTSRSGALFVRLYHLGREYLRPLVNSLRPGEH